MKRKEEKGYKKEIEKEVKERGGEEKKGSKRKRKKEKGRGLKVGIQTLSSRAVQKALECFGVHVKTTHDRTEHELDFLSPACQPHQ